jgi:hypothetical protein
VSNDGKVWDWGDDIKEQNKEFGLYIPEKEQSKENKNSQANKLDDDSKINVHCIAFQQDETSSFFVGSESSSIY